MTKHPPADDNEATLAAMAYLPGVAPLIFLTLEQGKQQYFVRYHLAHGFLLDLSTLLALALAALVGMIPQAPGAAYWMMGLLMFVVIMGSLLMHLVAGVQAYRKRLVVWPLITPVYYRLSRGS